MTPEQIDTYLREPHIADLATVRPDGSPHVAPVWFHYDGDKVMVIAETSAVKVGNIRHEPRVSVSIATHQEPYRYVIVNGTAVISSEGIPELVRTMAVNYSGKVEGELYAERVLRELSFCLITITPTKVIGWSGES